MNVVLDSSAMISYLNGEEGMDIVEKLLGDPSYLCYAHAVNLCEVFYDKLRGFLKTYDRATARNMARQVIVDLVKAGVIPRNDMDISIWEQTGFYKAEYKIALGDCFGLSLSKHLNSEFVTADHGELDKITSRRGVDILLKDGDVKVFFIR